MAQDLKEEVTVIEDLPEQQEMLASDFTEVKAKGWQEIYLFIKGTYLACHVDAFDHTSVSERWDRCFPGTHKVIGQPLLSFGSQKFMRLLSARHSNGFYIYFLEKLII